MSLGPLGPPAEIGEAMLADTQKINRERMRQCQHTSKTGEWVLSQLRIGGSGTVGARTALRHDEHDSLCLQVSACR